MTLQKRALLIILVTITCLQASLYFFVDQILLQEFHEIEDSTVRGHVSRVLHAFKNTELQLAAKVGDWAAWDDSYEFIENGSKEYVEETFNYFTLSAMQLRHLVYFDKAGQVKYDNEVFYRQEKVDHIPAATLELLRKAPLSLSEKDPVRTGSLVLDQSLVLYVTAPIVDSKKEKPARGALLGTVDVNPEMIGNIAKQTNLALTAFRIGIDPLGVPENNAINALKGTDSAFIRKAGNEMWHGYGLLRDSTGQPALLFRIDNPRTIYQQALAVRNFMLGSLGVAGAIWAFLAWWLVSHWIIRPLTLLSGQMKEIATNRDSALRLPELAKGHSLKLRATVILTSTMALMSVAVTFIFSRVLTEEFSHIEVGEMVDNVERVRRAIDERNTDILSKTLDWAQWDDTYQFVVDKNSDYAEANIIYETVTAINMSHVLYYNTDRNLVTGRFVDYEKESIQILSKNDQKALDPFNTFINSSSEATTAYIRSGPSVYLAAMSPILDTSRTKPVRGYFLFATPLNDYFKQTLAKQTQLALELIAPDVELKDQNAEQATEDPAVRVRSESEIVGYLPLNDASQKHILTLRVTSPRNAYLQGVHSQKLLILWLVGVSLAFLAITLFAIQRWVIARVEELKLELIQKTAGVYQPKLGESLDRDELSRLSNDINAMLEALNLAQSDLVKARDSAEAANQAKSTFIAKVSHELRTPIASITGMHRMIMKKEQSRAIRELIKVADDAAWGLLDIINEILDFSKAESGNLTIEKIPFDLRKIVRETTQTVSGRMADKDQLDFVCDIDKNVPSELEGDPTKLRQILMNLLGNSIKFTQSGHVGLRITAEQPLPHQLILKIAVWDTGIGIPSNKLDTIFEPFRQVDESVTRKFQGTGLGLSIVKQFVEALGGSITVSSVDGQGSSFNLRIPMGVSLNTAQGNHSSLPKVLVLQDGLPSTEVLVQGLKERGVSLESALGDSIQSLDAARELTQKFDLLVLTEKAAGNSHLIDLIHERSARPNLRTVAILRTSRLELREALYAKGINAILSTPVTADDLLASYNEVKSAHEPLTSLSLPKPPQSKKLRVLIADDAATNRIILEDMLLDAGHEVVAVNDGQQAIDKIMPMLCGAPNSEQFDILLTDVSMPILDGYTVTQMIRSTESKQGGKYHLPILAVTAHAMSAELNRMREAGVDGVITKPLKPESVAAEMERCMRAKG